MGYRLIVVLASFCLLTGCAAFDSSSEPYEGFSPDEVPPPPSAATGIYTGYYAGNITYESNTCASVTDEVGAAVPLAVDVLHQDTTINTTFDDGTTAAGTLEGEKVTLLTEDAMVKYVYFFAFEDGKVTGSGEVIEANADGQFADPCAKYSFELTKGEKPAEEAKEEEKK